MAIATVAILSFLLCMPLLPSKVTLKPGDICPEDIFARKAIRYEDPVETQQRRDAAAQNVKNVYDSVPNATDEAIGTLETIFRTVEDVKTARADLSGPKKVEQIRKKLGKALASQVSDGTFITLLAVPPKVLRDIRDSSLRIISSAMAKDLVNRPSAMKTARASVMTEARRLLADSSIANAVGEIVGDSLKSNRVLNGDRTAELQDKAREGVQPISKWMEKGSLVVGKGDRVLQEHMEMFEALGLRHPLLDYRSVLSLILLVIVTVSIVTAYLWRYHNEVYSNTKALYLLAIIVVVCTLALRLGGSMLGISLLPSQVGYLGLLWVVTASMFIAVLLNPHVAILITSILAIVLSLQLNNELRYAASALMTSLVGVYSVANIRDRKDLTRAFGLLTLSGVAMVWIMGNLDGDTLKQMIEGTWWSAIVALLAVTFFWFGIAPLERPFGATTHMSLLELADTNRPLLRQLVMEAPGTYTHSMAVGHLAETAAEVIGADSLVARVASYYHDIGKIRRPHFFIENQNVENVHDKMNPTLSALVITSHIKDGIDTAKEFRIPKVVLDIIAEHHGTSLVQYFYSQMSGEHEPSTALEQQFRYPGPKPQTKEAAVVMLADSVEAASRGISKPTLAKIEMLVNKIVADKLRDGQLDECELTFKDLSKITDCFVRSLTSIMHARIEYPDVVTNGDRKPAADADSDSELSENTGEAAKDSQHSSQAPAS
ncbi:MAG: HDIG domain-containing protein [Armatimonadetes bacterium]|nr:HDIG domain-containing protein [Armatimonadota bacterium]